jgi:hypothetical protein
MYSPVQYPQPVPFNPEVNPPQDPNAQQMMVTPNNPNIAIPEMKENPDILPYNPQFVQPNPIMQPSIM